MNQSAKGLMNQGLNIQLISPGYLNYAWGSLQMNTGWSTGLASVPESNARNDWSFYIAINLHAYYTRSGTK
jgi:hypothetical protein